jgi:hypothetical protein
MGMMADALHWGRATFNKRLSDRLIGNPLGAVRAAKGHALAHAQGRISRSARVSAKIMHSAYDGRRGL